jgi:hypothetical protein
MEDKQKTGHTTSKNPANADKNSIGNILPTSNIHEKEIDSVLRSGVSMGVVASKNEFDTEVLYKESRSLLKTNSLVVGRDTEQLSLFTIQDYQDRELEKKSYPRMVGVLMQYLTKEWQKRPRDKDGYLVIENLQEIADKLKTTPQRVKLFLVMAGGWTYPFVRTIKSDKKTGKKDIVIKHEHLFNIEIICRVDESIDLQGLLVGTTYTNFIKNYPVKAVRVKPSDTIINNIAGDKKQIGLGNIFATEDTATIGLDMGDMAYKLFCLAGSNKPSFVIGWEKLTKQLGITKQYISKQGKPRVKKQIERGLKELVSIGAFEYWKFNEDRELYSWKYTDKYFKHKDGIVKKS